MKILSEWESVLERCSGSNMEVKWSGVSRDWRRETNQATGGPEVSVYSPLPYHEKCHIVYGAWE